jgi:hypothetical protein
MMVGSTSQSNFSHSASSCAETSLQSRTAWGPFFERKTRKMSPHGGGLKRDLFQMRLKNTRKTDHGGIVRRSPQQSCDVRYTGRPTMFGLT